MFISEQVFFLGITLCSCTPCLNAPEISEKTCFDDYSRDVSLPTTNYRRRTAGLGELSSAVVMSRYHRCWSRSYAR